MILMTTAVIKHFDTLDYVEKSKKLGVDENVAKYQARQIEKAIDIAVNTARTEIENKDLATKHDIKKLEVQIHQTKFELVIWLAGFLIASSLIQHFFK